jgi:copper oxidase (laccase) domain-containing protein
VLVTKRPDRPLSIWAGDCAPLVLCGGAGTLVAAHAGWRGLAAGVIDVAVDELTRRDDHAVVAVLGPCIHAECYEFGARDLAAVAAGVGVAIDQIARPTSTGRMGLDVPAAVCAGLRRRAIDLDVVGPCTSCDERWFSHRARQDVGRHAVVTWTTSTTPPDLSVAPERAATPQTRAAAR